MARNKKAKEYASLATQAEGSQAAAEALTVAHIEKVVEVLEKNDQLVPALEPWVAGDMELRQLAQRVEVDYMKLIETSRRCIEEKWYERFGYVDVSAYFEDRIGLSYRTVVRRLAILKGIMRLPEEERPEAKAILTELGAHKAAAIAPMMGKPGQDWKKAAETAASISREAVQSMVSERMGAAHRGLPAGQNPGQRMLDLILNMTPPDHQERARWIFAELMRLAESTNPVAVWLLLLDLGEQELAAQGIVRDEKE